MKGRELKQLRGGVEVGGQFSLLNDADCECLAIKIQTPSAPTISCQESSRAHCHFLDSLQWHCNEARSHTFIFRAVWDPGIILKHKRLL